MTIRRTDSPNESTYYQTGRIAQQNSEWFYMTREGRQRGPFKRREDAEGDLMAFLLYLNDVYDNDNYQSK